MYWHYCNRNHIFGILFSGTIQFTLCAAGHYATGPGDCPKENLNWSRSLLSWQYATLICTWDLEVLHCTIFPYSALNPDDLVLQIVLHARSHDFGSDLL